MTQRIYTLLISLAISIFITVPVSGAENASSRSIAKRGTTNRVHRHSMQDVQAGIYKNESDCIRSTDPLNFALEGLAKYKDAGTLSSPERMGLELCLADALGLRKIEYKFEIRRELATGEIVSLADIADIDLSYISDPERHVVKPWVRDYLIEFVDYLKGASPILSEKFRVTSTLRHVDLLRREGGTPVSCNTSFGTLRLCSTHATAATIDIGNHPDPNVISRERRAKILQKLLCDRATGRMIFIAEHWGPHFHVFVLPPNVRVPDLPGEITPVTRTTLQESQCV